MTPEDLLWERLRAVARDGEPAWQPLLIELEPWLTRLVRNLPVGRLRRHEDTPREIITRVLARLHANQFTAIQKLCSREPKPPVSAWLRLLLRRSAVDYMRESPEFERGNTEREHRWISLSTLSSDAPAPLPDSLAEKRTEVLRFMNETVERARSEHRDHGDDAIGRLSMAWKISRLHVRRLIDRSTQYLTVLTAVLEGRSYAEIANLLGTTRREVELTVTYIEALLRERGFR